MHQNVVKMGWIDDRKGEIKVPAPEGGSSQALASLYSRVGGVGV